VWNSNGQSFAAAAGKKLMIHTYEKDKHKNNTQLGQMKGTIYALVFLPNNHQLAVAVYGGLDIMNLKGEMQFHLEVGASAIFSCAISNPSEESENSIAIGCMDKRVRVFRQDCYGNHDSNSYTMVYDWIGFNGRVYSIEWSSDNQYLAACDGTDLLVIHRNLPPGDTPILCTVDKNSSNITPKFQSFEWAKENLLVALTDNFILHVFNIHLTDDAVLKKCYPITFIDISIMNKVEKKFKVSFKVGDSVTTKDVTELRIFIWSGCTIQKFQIKTDNTMNTNHNTCHYSKAEMKKEEEVANIAKKVYTIGSLELPD